MSNAEVSNQAHLMAAEVYLRSGLLEPALEHIEGILREDPSNADALLMRGRIALERKDFGAARRHFEGVLRTTPDSPPGHHWLGLTHLRMRSPREAVSHLGRACELMPDSGQFHYQHAMALQAAGREEAARHALRRAAETLADPHQAYTMLGIMAQTRGEDERAEELYRRAIRAAPGRAAVASNNLAELMLSTGRPSPVALALAYHSHSSCPPQFKDESADTLAKALISLGEAAAALPAARLASRAKPEDAGRLLRLGVAENAAGNPDRALAALREAEEKGKGQEASRLARELIKAMLETLPDRAEPTEGSNGTDH
jgi:Tfp pilus assembly protein PilF